MAFRNRDGESRRDGVALSRSKSHGLSRDDVETGRAIGRVSRCREPFAVGEAL
jgi:hypothetical protein